MLRPDHQEAVEETNNLLANNLPIPRSHLYLICPEMFEYEKQDFSRLAELKNDANRLILFAVYLKGQKKLSKSI